MRPTVAQPLEFPVAPNKGRVHRLRLRRSLAQHPVMGNQLGYPLDGGRFARLQLKGATYERCYRGRNHDGAGRGQTRHPRSQVGSEAVHIVLGGVQIDEPAMYPCPRSDRHPELALDLLAETRHLAGDFQSRQHCATHIVLVGFRVTEYR